MDFLNDQEKNKVIQFNQDELMKQAVRKVILAGLFDNGTLKHGEKPNFSRNFAVDLNNSDDSDEVLGRKLRAKVEGIRTVEIAFDELSKYLPEKPKKQEKGNKAL